MFSLNVQFIILIQIFTPPWPWKNTNEASRPQTLQNGPLRHTVRHAGRRNNTIYLLWEMKFIVIHSLFCLPAWCYVAGVYWPFISAPLPQDTQMCVASSPKGFISMCAVEKAQSQAHNANSPNHSRRND